MKVKNLKAKPYIIQCKKGNILLIPAGPAVELPEGADMDYLNTLSANGMVELINEDEQNHGKKKHKK